MNRRAVLMGAVATVVLALMWYFLLWTPRNRALEEARERRETAEQQVSQLQSEIARLRAAQREEPVRRARLEALRTAIPDDPGLAQLILDTNDAANRAGIDFISIAPSLPAAPAAAGGAAGGGGAPPPTTAPPARGQAAGPPPPEIRLTLQIRGGYFQVLDFLNRLDDLPRLVVIDGLNISSDPNARLTVSVTARAFVRSVPAGFAAPGAPGGGATPPTTAAPRP